MWRPGFQECYRLKTADWDSGKAVFRWVLEVFAKDVPDRTSGASRPSTILTSRHQRLQSNAVASAKKPAARGNIPGGNPTLRPERQSGRKIRVDEMENG